MKYDENYYKQKNIEAEEKVKDILKNYHKNPEHMVEFFEFSSRFYNYSINNTILIYSQNKEASFVQGFNAWKKMGYSVKRGQHGMDIWMPVQMTYLKIDGSWVRLSNIEDEKIKEDYKAGKIESRQTLGFRLGKTYDISQTTCPLEHYPNFFMVGRNSREHAEMLQGLVNYNEKHLNTRVVFEDLNSMYLKGFNVVGKNEIHVNNMFGETQQLSTLIHETGHQILHQDKELLRNRPRIEFEADAFSIMAHTYLGLDIEENRKAHMVKNFKQMMEIYRDDNKDMAADEVRYLSEVMGNIMNISKMHMDDIVNEIDRTISKNKSMENKVKINCKNRKAEMEVEK